jgi:hypothetical protein
MKFLLSMIFCTSVYNTCLEPFQMPDIYDSHYDCMEAGYEESLKKIKELGKEEVNKYGTLVKFFCAQTDMAEEENELIIPKPKPKIQSNI